MAQMENMKKELELQDLESAAGGFLLMQLTPNERGHYKELQERFIKARIQHDMGNLSYEVVLESERELYEYTNYLKEKYD